MSKGSKDKIVELNPKLNKATRTAKKKQEESEKRRQEIREILSEAEPITNNPAKKLPLIILITAVLIAILLGAIAWLANNFEKFDKVEQTTNNKTKTECLIKGNISSSGKKLYYLPADSTYKAVKIAETQGERWFCQEKEAIKNGWERANPPELLKTFD